MNVSTLLDEIVTQGSLDAAPADLLSTLDRRHKTMCRVARSYMKTVDGDLTVADQQLYDVPAGLVEARELTLNGVTMGKANHKDISTNALGLLLTSGPGKVFAETRDSAGVRKLALIPIPSIAGDRITVFGAYEPVTLLINDSVPLRVDDEALEGLKAGVWASAMGWPSEGRQDMVAGYEQVFSSACEGLRMRVKLALRGAGPLQIRMSSPY